MFLHHDIRLSVIRAHHDDLIREAQGTFRRRPWISPGAPDRRYSHR